MAAPTAPVPEFLPPKRRADETHLEYVERLDWHKAQVPDDVLHAPIRGYVAGPGYMTPWWKADYIGPAGTGETGQKKNVNVWARTTVTVPVWEQPVQWKRRTPAERIAGIRDNLTALAIQSYADGVMRLPRSICEKLALLGVYQKAEDAQGASVEEVTSKFEAYAVYLMERAKTDRDLTPEVGRPVAELPATAQEAVA